MNYDSCKRVRTPRFTSYKYAKNEQNLPALDRIIHDPSRGCIWEIRLHISVLWAACSHWGASVRTHGASRGGS